MDWNQLLPPSLRVKQAAYTRVEVTAPWGFDFIPYRHTKFGVVSEGCCYLDLKQGEAPVKLERGSCYLLTRGDAFRLRDTPEGMTIDFEEALNYLQGRLLRYGGGGESCTVVGGRFIFEDEAYPRILDLLPPLVHFRVDQQELDSLLATVELLGKEAVNRATGSEMMINRLAELFFIQTLRGYHTANPTSQIGWLGSAADERLSQAVCLIHQQYHLPWSVASLAKEVGMSRAVFAARFKAHLGIAPMAYLTRHRLEQAQQKLQRPQAVMAKIAQEVGYSSEAAFSKAFKRTMGVSPGAYRASVCEA